MGCVGRIKSTTAPTRDEKKRLLFHQYLWSCFQFLSFHSFRLCCFLSFRLPSQIVRLFKGRNNHSSSIRRGELDLVILKRTWKNEVVTVCWYGIEQWLWQCLIVFVFVLVCAHDAMSVRVVSSTFVHAVLIDGYWIGYYSLDLDIVWRDRVWYRILQRGREEKIEFLVLGIAYLWILCTVCTYPLQWWRLWILARLSVVHLSPTVLSHTQRHCRHAQLDGRLLQGCIRLHKLYCIFLQPASLYASTITSYRICFNCSHSCEIPCIPMFYGCLLLQSLPISLFASLAFWYPFLHLCIFSKFFPL